MAEAYTVSDLNEASLPHKARVIKIEFPDNNFDVDVLHDCVDTARLPPEDSDTETETVLKEIDFIVYKPQTLQEVSSILARQEFVCVPHDILEDDGLNIKGIDAEQCQMMLERVEHETLTLMIYKQSSVVMPDLNKLVKLLALHMLVSYQDITFDDFDWEDTDTPEERFQKLLENHRTFMLATNVRDALETHEQRRNEKGLHMTRDF